MADAMGLGPANHLDLFEKKMLKKLKKGGANSANDRFKSAFKK